MNVIDYIILGLISVLLLLAVVLVIKRKKSGKGCSGNCSGCNICKYNERSGQNEK